ncbi:MAG: reductive dehalogenase domain-containing protein [Desulfobacterales bacterium]|jgi:reductive dehalogenase
MFWLIIGIYLFFLILAAMFTIESIKEKEPRAPIIGLCATIVLASFGVVSLVIPAAGIIMVVGFVPIVLFGISCLFPGSSNARALKGAAGYIVGQYKKFDERDIVFARNRSLPPGSEVYRQYYHMHPEKEEMDATRRLKGGPVGRVGSIDKGYRPNVSMALACFDIPEFLGPQAKADSHMHDTVKCLSPSKASTVVKGFAKHLGADLVGICKVNPLWSYSHRGEIFYDNWQDWGREISQPLPYAVVIGTEMDFQNVGAGPHTPALIESAKNYARGAVVATILSRWFGFMGYRGVAHHSRHYDMPLIPLAIDAGLGELGRFGYLITDRFGPRVRLFAATTDMPLMPDTPIDLGVEGFCRRCLKCAEACPSRSIPRGEKTIFNGVEKWKLNEETCFEYWGRAGTDCSICMGICPFSRPKRSFHHLAKWMIRRAPAARRVFPYIDNFIYGKKWRSRNVSDWIRYPKGSNDAVEPSVFARK